MPSPSLVPRRPEVSLPLAKLYLNPTMKIWLCLCMWSLKVHEIFTFLLLTFFSNSDRSIHTELLLMHTRHYT